MLPLPGPPVVGMDVQVHHVQFSEEKLKQNREETDSDNELMAFKEDIYHGWSSSNKEIPDTLGPYWSYSMSCPLMMV